MSDERLDNVEHYLRLAMKEAERAVQEGNHPYGAVIVAASGAVIATGRNGANTDHDPSSHAEMNAVRAACRRLGTLALDDYWLFTNGPPCAMCATVMIAARLGSIWYGAPSSPERTMPTLEELVERSSGAKPTVHQGTLAEEASAQLLRLS
ncbi:MAG: nucleoside deaminase [Thermomicrobiales bacterium]|jgi:tRNA(adenine34) deaminase|nr:nucleoside deaminase [Thermomicrobiales bacterium]